MYQLEAIFYQKVDTTLKIGVLLLVETITKVKKTKINKHSCKTTSSLTPLRI